MEPMPVIRGLVDIRFLKASATAVKVECELTAEMLSTLIERCPVLERLAFTGFAWERTSKEVFELMDLGGLKYSRLKRKP